MRIVATLSSFTGPGHAILLEDFLNVGGGCLPLGVSGPTGRPVDPFGSQYQPLALPHIVPLNVKFEMKPKLTRTTQKRDDDDATEQLRNLKRARIGRDGLRLFSQNAKETDVCPPSLARSLARFSSASDTPAFPEQRRKVPRDLWPVVWWYEFDLLHTDKGKDVRFFWFWLCQTPGSAETKSS